MLPTQRFHSADLVRLTAALDACVRPLDFPSLEEWRATLLGRVMDLLEAPIGHFDLRGLNLPQATLSRGYEDGVFETYVREWLQRDPAYDMHAHLELTTYTRRLRHRSAGALWTERYKRSEVYNEFYRPNGLIDGAGILFHAEGIGVHLHAETRGEGGELMDERGRQLLLVLEPALRSTVSSLRGASAHRWQAQALLDAVNEPLALLAESGEWVHRTNAMGRLLEQQAPQVREALILAAGQVAIGLFRMQAPGGPPAWVSASKARIECHGVLVSGVLLGHEGPFARAYALVRMESMASGAMIQAARARAAGLTPREVEVARLLARGMSDRAIAHDLQVSWHAARRHTENVLKKLGISSRSGVAHALSRPPDASM